MAVPAKSLELVDPATLLISHSSYAGLSPAEARKAIRAKLDDTNFVVALERIDKKKINDILGKDLGGTQVSMPNQMETFGQMEGVALVRAYYDATNNTGIIKAGHHVVFDTVKGNAVTGIHETWTTDEYKIAGVALEDYSTVSTEGKRILVRLAVAPPTPEIVGDYCIGRVSGDISGLTGCDWITTGDLTAGTGLDATDTPEFQQTTGYVYAPQIKSNGKLHYGLFGSGGGLGKFYYNLPFDLTFQPRQSGLGNWWVTRLLDGWLLKHPVVECARFNVGFNASLGLQAGLSQLVLAPIEGSQVGAGRVAEWNESSTPYSATIKFRASLWCDIIGSVGIRSNPSGGTLQRTDLFMNSTTGGGLINRISNELVGGTTLSGEYVHTHHFNIRKKLTYGESIYFAIDTWGPQFTVISGGFRIIPIFNSH